MHYLGFGFSFPQQHSAMGIGPCPRSTDNNFVVTWYVLFLVLGIRSCLPRVLGSCYPLLPVLADGARRCTSVTACSTLQIRWERGRRGRILSPVSWLVDLVVLYYYYHHFSAGHVQVFVPASNRTTGGSTLDVRGDAESTHCPWGPRIGFFTPWMMTIHVWSIVAMWKKMCCVEYRAIATIDHTLIARVGSKNDSSGKFLILV